MNKGKKPLGHIKWDGPAACTERVVMRSPLTNHARIFRNQFVHIEDPLGDGTGFLGRIVAGPFFRSRNGKPRRQHTSRRGFITAQIEIQGELVNGCARDAKSRPKPGAAVQELGKDEVASLLGYPATCYWEPSSARTTCRFTCEATTRVSCHAM